MFEDWSNQGAASEQKENGSNGRRVSEDETGQVAISVKFVKNNHELGGEQKSRHMERK